MITLRSATCAATLSMWLLPGYCGCLLSLALSCTLMAIEVVFEFVLLPCLQFLLLCVALPMWLVLAYYFFEALHYVSSWCSKWWSFRVNSVSGYNRGSSYRKVRRWLRRFWLNTCDNLSHSLFCVRRWASATKRHWAQPLRESSAAARAAFFSTRTSSSRLARRKNSRMQKTDRTKGGGEAHRREGPGLLLLPFAGLGCSGFVASFCCVFGAMMMDKLPAVTFYYGVMSGALPVALATASINNNPPRKNHLQHLDDGSEGIAGTEVVHNSTSVDDGELSNGVHKRKQKMRVNYSGEMTDIQEDEEIPTASSFVVVSTGQGTREGTIFWIWV
ncbi:unnamed protein product [Amoebophrya sp. A25]|nr:unnamed protein product [Amoebophrya sp. A25]|eukprot:GSA25T00002954001.1